VVQTVIQVFAVQTVITVIVVQLVQQVIAGIVNYISHALYPLTFWRTREQNVRFAS
jgi:hypothetical protein